MKSKEVSKHVRRSYAEMRTIQVKDAEYLKR